MHIVRILILVLILSGCVKPNNKSDTGSGQILCENELVRFNHYRYNQMHFIIGGETYPLTAGNFIFKKKHCVNFDKHLIVDIRFYPLLSNEFRIYKVTTKNDVFYCQKYHKDISPLIHFQNFDGSSVSINSEQILTIQETLPDLFICGEKSSKKLDDVITEKIGLIEEYNAPYYIQGDTITIRIKQMSHHNFVETVDLSEDVKHKIFNHLKTKEQ